jgi:ABC-type transport system involved in Fe-S cluster assembly fused permease/ATPase subunit
LVIAYRLSTIRNADKIIALEGGHIIEIGDHRDKIYFSRVSNNKSHP